MFDKIIMNPPYNGNLHLKILQEAMKHGDEIVNLSPIRWLQDPLSEYKKNSDWFRFEDIRTKIESLETIDASLAHDLFDIQHSDLGIYHLSKDSNGFKRDTSLDTIMKKILDKSSEDSFKDHITSNRTGIFIDVLDLYGGVIGKGSGFVKPLGYERKQSSTSKGCTDGWRCMKFDTKEEAENFYNACNTNMYYFIFIKFRSYLRLLMEYVPYLGDYTHPWTDEDLYEYFGLTDDEIKEIECSIK